MGTPARGAQPSTGRQRPVSRTAAAHPLRQVERGHPGFDRNPNTGALARGPEDLHPATQTILHDENHPSHLMLPVIPRG